MSVKAHDKDSPFPPLKDSVLRVYSMRFCPHARRTLLVLEHKKIPYETVNINLKSKPDWFLERNPLGTVPTIERDGIVLYESTAICEWIDDVYPNHRLLPSDPLVKAQDRMLLEYLGKIFSVLTKITQSKGADDSALKDELNKHYKHYEDALAKREGPFFGGATPSLLDFYLWPLFDNIACRTIIDKRLEVSETDYPALTRWYANMYEVPAVKTTGHSPETLNHFTQSYFSGKPDYDYGL